MPTKYDPNHRQLQITNKLLFETLKEYLSYLRDRAKTDPSAVKACGVRFDGAKEFLLHLGLEVRMNDNQTDIVGIHKVTKDSPVKIKK